ncbi:MAG: hypothetical protein OQK95_12550 [Gammaproteobacteria bacterium]|nr:hypothetical protein [Gammaproteobacteria bacterium]
MKMQKSKPENIHFGLAILYVISWVFVSFALPVIANDEFSFTVTLLLMIPLILPAILHYFVGAGVKQRKEWARQVSIIIGFFLLFLFPIGTILGIFLMVRLSKGNWNKMIEEEAASSPA